MFRKDVVIASGGLRLAGVCCAGPTPAAPLRAWSSPGPSPPSKSRSPGTMLSA